MDTQRTTHHHHHPQQQHGAKEETQLLSPASKLQADTVRPLFIYLS
jgi:hypothetical protein